jgi:myo-inositol-1(or 4)-monophosphatase
MTYKNVAIKATREAGKILRNNFFNKVKAESKGKHDLVTITDRASEKIILKILKSYYPAHNFVAEESGSSRNRSKYTWYIDPLDGTSNFVTGNPFFSVSIGLALENEIILGVVFNPLTNELYFAEKGKGSYLNDQRLKTSLTNKLSDALISSAYSKKESDIRRGLKTIEKLALNSRKVVVNFSPALVLCNIARGRLDAIVDNGTTPEDHAAGSLILTEAGGKIQNYNSKNWDVREIGITATNGKLRNSIINLIKK